MKNKNNIILKPHPKICVIGLGYVGLPLAVHLSTKFDVIGFDLNPNRVDFLNKGEDSTKEVNNKTLLKRIKGGLKLISNEADLPPNVNVFVVTVPTPVNKHNVPELDALISASEFAGRNISKGAIVVYESTVFPGCTEEICIPAIEKASGMRYEKDFFCGYSPERINPGDRKHTFDLIPKVVSGSNEIVAKYLSKIYKKVIKAEVYTADSIKIAEASKVIENSQRDINIAFINELALIFNKLNIDTDKVLEAASTKWNFLNFRPGLVGGHCIGVDPYYLAYKASEVGIHPEITLAGRRINNNMHSFVASQVMKKIIQRKISPKKARIGVLGLTFKENCPDTRNSKAFELINELKDYELNIFAHDPYIKNDEIEKLTNAKKLLYKDLNSFDLIILCVEHEEYKKKISNLKKGIPLFVVSKMCFKK